MTKDEGGINVGPAPATAVRRPPCKLSGTDGNVFAVIGRVQKALRRAGEESRAHEFVERAFGAGSYDEVLRLCFEYVEVR